MNATYNVYCDESSHLEHDHQPVMVLGAVWCPAEKVREASVRLREIKAEHGLSRAFEIKWNKVSPAGIHFYERVLDFFFDDNDLRFCCLIVPDKAELERDPATRDRDAWSADLYVDMLRIIFAPGNRYRVYLDIKDTWGQPKVEKLQEALANSTYDFAREMVERVQQVRSREVELLQLADLLIGAVSYANRGSGTSAAKSRLVERMRERSGYALTRSTLHREEKVNLFVRHAATRV